MRNGLAIGVAIFVVALPLVGLEATARSVNVDIPLHEGGYYYLEIIASGSANGSDLDARWTSTLPIDAWIMARQDFEHYKGGSGFAFEIHQAGTSGAIVFNVSVDRRADEPFYLVFDHSAKGPTAPPAAAGDDVASISLAGETRMETYRSGWVEPSPSGQLALDAVYALAVIIPLALVGLVLVLRMRKKRRAAAIRATLESGGHAGAPAAAPKVETISSRAAAAAAAASPPPAPPGWPAAAAPRYGGYSAPPPQPCRSCGAPLTPGINFCRQCGAPL